MNWGLPEPPYCSDWHEEAGSTDAPEPPPIFATPAAASTSAPTPSAATAETKRRLLTLPPFALRTLAAAVSASRLEGATCQATRTPSGSVGRLDQHEVPQDAVEVRDHLRIGQRHGHVLAHRVQAAAVAPRVQDVPAVCVLVDRVHRRRDPAFADGPAAIGEAGHGRPDQLALVEVLRN